MASTILKTKSFPGLVMMRKSGKGDSDIMVKNSNRFGLTKKSPRCAQCLKFQADDPPNVEEDEIEKLFSCSICQKVKYCSKNCQKLNYPFHKLFCKELQALGEIRLTGQGESSLRLRQQRKRLCKR